MDVQMHEAGISGHGNLNDSILIDGADADAPCPPSTVRGPNMCLLSSSGTAELQQLVANFEDRLGKTVWDGTAVMASEAGKPDFPMPSTSYRGWGRRGYPGAAGYDERGTGYANATLTD